MKNITKSLLMIAVVAALAIGGTVAYFSDTEKSVGNTISAGTIDISVDNENPWNKTYTTQTPDLKPGESKTVEFTIKNEGSNPAVIRKMLDHFVYTRGNNEPKCVAFGGTWNGSSCTATYNEDITDVMSYEMTVTPEGGSPITIISEDQDIDMTDVDSLWMPLGTIEPRKTLTVKQIYTLSDEADNKYQGDSFTFDITLYAEQRLGPGLDTVSGVILDNKTGGPDWYSNVDDTWGILNRTGTNYDFRGFGLEVGQTYRLAYSLDPYNTFSVLATGTVDPDGNIVLSGTNLPASLSKGKIWLLYGSSGWGDNLKNLWEDNLLTY